MPQKKNETPSSVESATSEILGLPPAADRGKATVQPAKVSTGRSDASSFTNDDQVEHYGSREETQAALEGKIANQNTRKLHEHR